MAKTAKELEARNRIQKRITRALDTTEFKSLSARSATDAVRLKCLTAKHATAIRTIIPYERDEEVGDDFAMRQQLRLGFTRARRAVSVALTRGNGNLVRTALRLTA